MQRVVHHGDSAADDYYYPLSLILYFSHPTYIIASVSKSIVNR